MATQAQQAAQMILQLRALDPSAGANLGSPERKLIDVTAQAVVDNQIDLTVLQSSLDIDSKFGSNLDAFLALFDFGRQAAVAATGFVTFSRNTPSTVNIPIPEGTRIQATADPLASAGETGSLDVVFSTTFAVILPAGETEIVAPIRCVTPGTVGNVAANTITTFVGTTPVLGITGVTNEAATARGRDLETDDDYKVRFKNTYLRNLAGTSDQYLALAISSSFTTKANVVGPISRYREYIQVPQVDDASSFTDQGINYGVGGGNPGEYTSALSTIPYAQHIYDTVPFFISNGEIGPATIFYRDETDFTMNTGTTRNRGDAYRLHNFDAINFPDPTANPNNPNITFMNVYTGLDPDVTSVRPGEVVLLEFSYMSSESRNDWSRLITNAIDVFVDSNNASTASTLIPRPNTSNIFVNDPTNKNYFDNFRRAGLPEHRPILGNVLTPLFHEPVTDAPDIIVVEGADTNTYYKGEHFWVVQDVSDLGGSARSRAGIEWSMDIRGQLNGDPDGGPYTGALITEHAADVSIPINNYTYDANILDLQGIYEGNKQVTTDILAHKARTRYFKLDITAMYSPGTSPTDANQAANQAVQDYFDSLYFGPTIQLSDLLQIVHSTSGFDNVRWSSDIPGLTDLNRVIETDVYGNPLANVILETIQTGTPSRHHRMQLYVTGDPTDGEAVFVWNNATINLSLGALTGGGGTALQDGLRALTGVSTLTVSGVGGKFDTPRIIDFGVNGLPAYTLGIQSASMIGGPRILDNDFFLRDNELPSLPIEVVAGDSVPGLIIRPRAQNTWIKG